ncbi:MAG TPA: hypothetical protein VN903_35175 [Polyangia bacterium]|jgi:hypothetical protein|nr:hypothetical protein [Polyangia bacterium]
MAALLRITAIATAIAAIVCASGFAHATEVGYSRKYGVGAVVGDPTGLSGKIWIGQTNAIDMGLGFYGYGYRGGCFRDRDGRAICDRRYGYGSTSVHVDYLWESKLIDKAAQLDWHIGAGGRAFFLGDPCAFDCWDVGVRGPLGLDLTFHQPSFLEVFMEIAPVLYVAPATFMALEGGLGVRGYF